MHTWSLHLLPSDKTNLKQKFYRNITVILIHSLSCPGGCKSPLITHQFGLLIRGARVYVFQKRGLGIRTVDPSSHRTHPLFISPWLFTLFRACRIPSITGGRMVRQGCVWGRTGSVWNCHFHPIAPFNSLLTTFTMGTHMGLPSACLTYSFVSDFL